MKITDTQLLDFRNAVRHKDYVAAARILKDVRILAVQEKDAAGFRCDMHNLEHFSGG